MATKFDIKTFASQITTLSNIVLMSLIFGIDVNSQLAKDIASLGLGFSQGKQVKLKHNTSKTSVFFCCWKVQTRNFARV